MNEVRALFLTGYPKTALLQSLVDQGVSLAALVIPAAEKYAVACGELVRWGADRGVPVIKTTSRRMADDLKALRYDVLLSCGYPFPIPPEVFKTPPFAVNFHPTLLPRHRGRYVHHVLMGNEPVTGVTAHLLEERMDTGPIVDREVFPVSPFDTVKSLLRKCASAEIPLMRRVIETLRAGRLKAIPQVDSQACEHFEKRTPADSEIDPGRPLRDLYHSIRACDPELYPAFFTVDGQKVFLRVWRKDKPAGEEDMI